MAPVIQVDLTQEDEEEEKVKLEVKQEQQDEKPLWWTKEIAEATQTSLQKYLPKDELSESDDEMRVLSEKLNPARHETTRVTLKLPRDQVDAVVSAMHEQGNGFDPCQQRYVEGSPLLSTVKKLDPSLQSIKQLSLIVSPNIRYRMVVLGRAYDDSDAAQDVRTVQEKEGGGKVTRTKEKKKKRKEGNIDEAQISEALPDINSPLRSDSPALDMEDSDGPPALVVMPQTSDSTVSRDKEMPTLQRVESSSLLPLMKATFMKPQTARRSQPVLTPIQKLPALANTQNNFLTTMPFKLVENKLFVPTLIFKELFVGFRINMNRLFQCLSVMRSTVDQHALFQDWEISHVSIEVAVMILRALGGRPRIVYDSFKSFLLAVYPRAEDFVSVYGDNGPNLLSDLDADDFCSVVGLCTHVEKKKLLRQSSATAKRSRTMLKELAKKKKEAEELNGGFQKEKEKPNVLLPLHSKTREPALARESLLPAGALLDGLCEGTLKPSFRLSLGRSEKEAENMPKVLPGTSGCSSAATGGAVTPRMKKKGVELPDGWKIRKGNKHYYYISPLGKKFTSLKQALGSIEVEEAKSRRTKRKCPDSDKSSPMDDTKQQQPKDKRIKHDDRRKSDDTTKKQPRKKVLADEKAKEVGKATTPKAQTPKSVSDGNGPPKPTPKPAVPYRYHAARKFASNCVPAKRRHVDDPSDDASKDLKGKKRKRSDQKLEATLPHFDLNRVPNPHQDADGGGWFTSKITLLSSLPKQPGENQQLPSHSNAAKKQISCLPPSNQVKPATLASPSAPGEATPPDKVGVTYSGGCNAIIDLPLWRERNRKRLQAAAAAATNTSDKVVTGGLTQSTATPKNSVSQKATPSSVPPAAAANKLDFLINNPDAIRGFECPPGVAKVTTPDGRVQYKAQDGTMLPTLAHACDYVEFVNQDMEKFVNKWF